MRRENDSVASACKTIPVLVVVSLLSLYCTKAAELINNPLYYLTNQVNNPEV